MHNDRRGARRRSFCRVATGVLLCLVGWCAPAAAAPEDATAPAAPADAIGAALPEGTISVRVVADRLMARCDVSTPKRRISGYVLIEFDNPCALALHNNVTNRDGLDADRQQWPITLHFPGFQVEGLWRSKGDQSVYDDITKMHAPTLDETPVIGTLGAAFFAPYHLIVDVDRGTLTLNRPKARSDQDPAPRDGYELVRLGAGDVLTWLPAALPDGSPGMLVLGSTLRDSILDPSLGRTIPVHALKPVRVGQSDATSSVAFRPGLVTLSHPDGALGVLGLDWLKLMRVDIDRVNGVAYVKHNEADATVEADRAFYAARADDEPAGYGAYLNAHKEGRHRGEAAKRWVDRLAERAVTDKPAWEAALKAYVDTLYEERRTSTMKTLMEELQEWGLDDASVMAAELGIEHGRKDKDPDAVHHIHAALGARYLERGQLRNAWKHLLSAAFGLPEDGRVNLNLGRVYEQQGRLTRAFSRYVQALIAPDAGPQALVALQRVQPKLGSDERFSVDLVERAIAGKGFDFSAPNVWEPKEGKQPTRVVLAEMFTNAAPPPIIAADLGFNGIRTHFESKHVVCVMHHIAQPALEPLATAASMRRIQAVRGNLGVLAVNGAPVARAAGKPREADKFYRVFKEHVLKALEAPSRFKLTGDARVKDGVLSGKLDIDGLDSDGSSDDALQLNVWLIERGVVYPGASRVVVHRNVMRGEIFKNGLPLLPSAKPRSFAYSVKLADMEHDIDAFLKSQAWRGQQDEWTTRFDLRELRVVAFIESQIDGVLQAVELDPTLPEELD